MDAAEQRRLSGQPRRRLRPRPMRRRNMDARGRACAEGFWTASTRRPVQTEKGSALIGRRYEPLFPFAGDFENAYQVVGAEFVTMEDGTGIVPYRPPPSDRRTTRRGKTHGLPTIQLVDEEGRFTKEAEPWAGVFVKDADPEIAADLEKTRTAAQIGAVQRMSTRSAGGAILPCSTTPAPHGSSKRQRTKTA